MANEIQQPNPMTSSASGPRRRHRPGLRGDCSTDLIDDGHDERTGFFNLGGGTGEHGQFALSVDLTGAAFQLDRLFVEVFEESARTARRSTRSSCR